MTALANQLVSRQAVCPAGMQAGRLHTAVCAKHASPCLHQPCSTLGSETLLVVQTGDSLHEA
jgi:hypothetical protein